METRNNNSLSLSEHYPLRIREFFDRYPLSESRELLWLWLRRTISDGPDHWPDPQKDNLFTFYVALTDLLEAIHSFSQYPAKETCHE